MEGGKFDVRVVEEPAGTTAATLAAYDVLVLDYNGPRLGAAAEQAMEEFVRGGKGLVVVHGASYAFNGLVVLGDGHRPTGLIEPPWPAYAKMAGGAWATTPKTGHGPRRLFTVKFTDREHPVTRGLGDSFVISDELYRNFALQPNIHVLATAWDDPKRQGTGKDEPLLWTVSYGSGRVFHTALGHDLTAMNEPAFVRTFVRGAEWAATGQASDPPAPKAKKRLLVVTGGHSYEPSLYKLFDSFAWTHEFGIDAAFRKDLREEYDALLLYNLEQKISEASRGNLRAFIESGRGVVILHHAIANFQDWQWWFEDVAGGKYLLKPEGGKPGSTYTHDIDIVVRPVGKHPIIAGIPEFRIRDEGYRGKWMAPGVNIVLEGESPHSDPQLAWVSAYPKARVAAIMLGHDHWAHEHPAFRQLVTNAVNWVADR
jgi:type 1 glutamine amidotransferase